ncbi:MAG: ATPase [Legionellales bacterium]|nr:ATPase [Legionellales bacterium]|tara:strand:- start:14093 stop:15712 length:1620 start_codon:yes stop_codon:yes gene_type:complete
MQLLAGIGKKPEEYSAMWDTLRVFNLYRLCLAVVLLILHYARIGFLTVGQHWPLTYVITDACYILLSIAILWFASRRTFRFIHLAIVAVFVDITVLTILMHASIGMTNGFGILINVAIAAGSIITAGQISLLFAAFATIVLLLGYSLSTELSWFMSEGYIHSGILGATFFITAVISYGLARRIRVSEALAELRGKELEKSEKLNHMIIQRMNSGVIVVDENANVRFINAAAQYLLGLTKVEGDVALDTLSKKLAEYYIAWQKLEAVKQRTFKSMLVEEDAIAYFVSLGHVDGENFGTLILLEDSGKMTQEAQQMKLVSLGRLTASIAHEIRNPLGAISHAAQLLEESEYLHQSDARLNAIIRDQSERMNMIIENVLQLSRRKQAKPTTIKLKEWLTQFFVEFKMHEYQKPIINVNVEPEDLEIFIDKSQLHQILTNLCENGLRYSADKSGTAKLQIEAGFTPDKNEPFIEIIDFGEGIPEESIQYIFEPFFTTKKGGTGLGLYLTRELCEANQARIAYYATEQGGSCFRITFFQQSNIQ